MKNDKDPKKATAFERMTNFHKHVSMPNVNKQQIPFEKWDWAEHDREFYESFRRLPDSQDPQFYRQVKWNRYHQAMPEARTVPSFAPRNFMKIMRWEIALVMFGIGMGCYLPTLSRQRNAMRAEANNATN